VGGRSRTHLPALAVMSFGACCMPNMLLRMRHQALSIVFISSYVSTTLTISPRQPWRAPRNLLNLVSQHQRTSPKNGWQTTTPRITPLAAHRALLQPSTHPRCMTCAAAPTHFLL